MATIPINACVSLNLPKKTIVTTILGLDPVPVGRQVRVLRFGAAAVGKAGEKATSVQLWWGLSLLVREFGVNEVPFESEVDRMLLSTGIERLRVVMNNDDANEPKQVIAWLDGYIL